MSRPALALVCAAFVVGTAGCALTSKADLVTVRYFTPEVSKTHATGYASQSPPSTRPQIRLGRITSGAHLRERIAYRDAVYEVGYYEDQRWTERPEIYVRRGITRTLFEEHGFTRTLGGAGPTLDVEVLAFDELRLPTGRAARVELKVVVFEDRTILFEETITVDRPVAPSGGAPKVEGTVAAMAEALDAASEQVATRIASTIAARAAPVTLPTR